MLRAMFSKICLACTLGRSQSITELYQRINSKVVSDNSPLRPCFAFAPLEGGTYLRISACFQVKPRANSAESASNPTQFSQARAALEFDLPREQ